MEKYLYPAFLIISIVAFVLYLYKTHTHWLGTVCVRAIGGIVAILVLNAVFHLLKVPCTVGVNAITISTVGLLGVPGLILMFGSVYFFYRV